MHLIGTIVALHVQETSLKVGEKPRRYDPAGIRPVPFLEINRGGVRGWSDDGSPIDDVHHADHPLTKQREGLNGISIGFTGHYREMRRRFSDHLVDGIAGENILVDYSGVLREADFGGNVVIVTLDGREIRLTDVIVAAPCVEFSRFSLRYPDDRRPDGTVAEALRFLNDGMRGFYAKYDGEPLRIGLGDSLYADPAENASQADQAGLTYTPARGRRMVRRPSLGRVHGVRGRPPVRSLRRCSIFPREIHAFSCSTAPALQPIPVGQWTKSMPGLAKTARTPPTRT